MEDGGLGDVGLEGRGLGEVKAAMSAALDAAADAADEGEEEEEEEGSEEEESEEEEEEEGAVRIDALQSHHEIRMDGADGGEEEEDGGGEAVDSPVDAAAALGSSQHGTSMHGAMVPPV